jgi:hypothetical protein
MIRGLAIVGYVGLLGLVLLLSSEGSGKRRSRKGKGKQLPKWSAWTDLGLFIIPAYAFAAFVLIQSGPILGVIFLVVVPVAVFEGLKGQPGFSQPGRWRRG